MGSSPAYYQMGQLADLMRSQLRELAQSDARQLRAIDEALKASRAVDDQLKRLKDKCFYAAWFCLVEDFAVFDRRTSLASLILLSVRRSCGSTIRDGGEFCLGPDL